MNTLFRLFVFHDTIARAHYYCKFPNGKKIKIKYKKSFLYRFLFFISHFYWDEIVGFFLLSLSLLFDLKYALRETVLWLNGQGFQSHLLLTKCKRFLLYNQ